MVKPRLADVRCTPVRFGPHDRVLVTTTHVLDSEASRRLRRSVARWAGVEEERVLVWWAGAGKIDVDGGRGGGGLYVP